MEIKGKRAILLAACLAALTPAALAQNSNGGGQGASGGSVGAGGQPALHYGSGGWSQGSRYGAPLQGGTLAMQPGQSQVMFRASQLIGANAQSPQGQNLGRIQDIVFHPEIGILGVVTTQSGRTVPIPWQLVSAITANSIVFNTTLQALNAAPTITGGEWANFNSPVFTHEIYAYYGIRPHSRMVAGAFNTGSNSGSASTGGGNGYSQGFNGNQGYGSNQGDFNQSYGMNQGNRNPGYFGNGAAGNNGQNGQSFGTTSSYGNGAQGGGGSASFSGQSQGRGQSQGNSQNQGSGQSSNSNNNSQQGNRSGQNQ